MADSLDGTHDFSLDTERVWDIIGLQIDRFTAAWDQGVPILADYLPRANDELRQITITELVKIDLEQRWSRGEEVRDLESYLEEFPFLLVEGRAPSDLIYEEYHVRKQNGHEVEPEEYLRRFPDQREEIARLLDVENPFLTTALRPGVSRISLSVGDQVDDFDLMRELGRGAFALVFLAHQRSMQRLVAVKVTVDRSQEPQTLARLDHPHIVRVYDQRQLPEHGWRLLYMQHVSGGTLLDAMRSVHAQPRGSWTGQALMDVVDLTLIEQGIDPPLGVEQRRRLGTMDWPSTVCLLGSQLASALDYSHQQGVLHRDLKPANILLNEGVLPKLVDFNVSSCSKLDGASPSSYFGGSLAYMSPEQLEACNPCHDRDPESLDGRSDVYALAVVLWEMLTGRRPFHDTQQPGGWPATVALMTAKRQDGLTDAHYEMLPANCPRSLRDILTRCLAPQPDERFRRAEDLAVQLRRSLNPNTQRLLSPPKRGWRGLVARFPALSTVVALLLPHTLAGIFNYEYNYHVIIDRYVEGHSEIETTFFLLSTIINAIAFPLGVIIGLRLIWTSTRAVRRRALSHEDSPANPAVRHRCLSLGHRLAVLGLALWLVAGVAYPICLSAAGAQLDAADYVHFFASLVVCGLIVGAYPFFGAFAMVVESWYPLLIGNGAVEREDLPVFQKLQKLSWYYLVTAVLVPMISVAILLTIQSIDPDVVVMLRFVSIMGIVLFIVVFALARRVQQDLAILEAEAASDEGH